VKADTIGIFASISFLIAEKSASVGKEMAGLVAFIALNAP
jgi:hypothetical protein